MTYRRGVWVIDTASGRIGRLMGTVGGRAQLRPPGGGREWETSPRCLRLASAADSDEREGWPEASRTLISYEQWTVTPDVEPDAEPIAYLMVCVVCDNNSPAAESPDGPQRWALEHSGRRPTHHTYRELIVRPWRTWMSDTPGSAG